MTIVAITIRELAKASSGNRHSRVLRAIFNDTSTRCCPLVIGSRPGALVASPRPGFLFRERSLAAKSCHNCYGTTLLCIANSVTIHLLVLAQWGYYRFDSYENTPTKVNPHTDHCGGRRCGYDGPLSIDRSSPATQGQWLGTAEGEDKTKRKRPRRRSTRS